MKPLLIAAGIALTVLCWGSYGPVLHKGQDGFNKDKLKPLICVGLSYMIVAIIVPLAILAKSGKLPGWPYLGISWSMTAGVCGALGALGIIMALTSGGKPTYVMPLVFGCAPIMTVVVQSFFAGFSWRSLSPVFVAGLLLISVGAATVLMFAPKGETHSRSEAPAAQQKASPAG